MKEKVKERKWFIVKYLQIWARHASFDIFWYKSVRNSKTIMQIYNPKTESCRAKIQRLNTVNKNITFMNSLW